MIRKFRRLLLIPRARRVRFERRFAELDKMLEEIRRKRVTAPPWQKYEFPDE